MKTNNQNQMKHNGYRKPAVEFITVSVEGGFALSPSNTEGIVDDGVEDIF